MGGSAPELLILSAVKYFETKSSLPKLPSLAGSEEFSKIEALFREKSERDWGSFKSVLRGYIKWEGTFAGAHTSALNRKLTLYKMLKAALPECEVLSSEELKDIILSTVKKAGEQVNISAPNSPDVTAWITEREITERFGILFTLRKVDGKIISHEFFD